MRKQSSTQWEPEIDQTYEQRVNDLGAITGSATDYEGDYQIEPVRQAQPTTWTPAKTAVERHQAERSAAAGQLRQIIDQQGQEPAQTATGNKFIVHEETSAKDRAGAGLRWWLLLAISALPLVFGLALWLFWGWGFFAFFFTCTGAGMLLGAILLNRQAINQSPIAIEKKQRDLDHEYRMYKEENAQRTRELVVGGFLGNAQADLSRQQPATVNSVALLVDHKNEVKR